MSSERAGVTLAGRVLRSANSSSRRRAVGAAIRLASPLLRPARAADQPVFVLGSPRSGTTMLFSVLAGSSALGALPGEGHLLWNLYHDERRAGWRSQATAPEAIARGERRSLSWIMRQIAGDRRYLDKTPRNSLQVPYLHALFPDAWFVVMMRDGRATVSSLIEGWRDETGMFPGRRLPVDLRIDGYGGSTWKFVAPPGWAEVATGHTLAEVCAFQWTACMDAILSAKALIRADRWIEVGYERFVASPSEETGRILDALHLPREASVMDRAATLDRRVTKATTAPRPDKWRDENPREVAEVLPLIEPTMRRMGYEV